MRTRVRPSRRLSDSATTASPRCYGFGRAMQRTLVELIAAKRDGATPHDGRDRAPRRAPSWTGELADYQMAALLMAVFFRGLDDAETVALTEAMLHSGRVLDLVERARASRSTSTRPAASATRSRICLAPLVAACGVPVPMVSGRGLGHTGGTLDKLEAIPGFRTDLVGRGLRAHRAATSARA